MVHSDGNPLRVAPMGERLKLSKQSAMNSRLPKQTFSLREKPPQVRCLSSGVTATVDE
jgi:hypothetical protein